MSTGLRLCSQIGRLDLVHIRNCSSALLSDAGCRNRSESGCREVQKQITSSGSVQNWSSSCVWEDLGSLLCLVLSPLIPKGCQLSPPPQCSGLPQPEVTSNIKCWCKHGLVSQSMVNLLLILLPPSKFPGYVSYSLPHDQLKGLPWTFLLMLKAVSCCTSFFTSQYPLIVSHDDLFASLLLSDPLSVYWLTLALYSFMRLMNKMTLFLEILLLVIG